jgi:hypothetical protein
MSARTNLAAALLLTVAASATACSGSLGTGSGVTTTAKPLNARDMCTTGQNAYGAISELDRSKPDYIDKVKGIVKPLPERAPADLKDDMTAWVDYVQQVTAVAQLASPPADLKVSMGRIDQWWQQNCGKAFFG